MGLMHQIAPRNITREPDRDARVTMPVTRDVTDLLTRIAALEARVAQLESPVVSSRAAYMREYRKRKRA